MPKIGHKRPEGFYWVKGFRNSEWEVMEFVGERFFRCGLIEGHKPSELFQIGRKLSDPDTVKKKSVIKKHKNLLPY